MNIKAFKCLSLTCCVYAANVQKLPTAIPVPIYFDHPITAYSPI